MELRHLRYFLVVGEVLNFTKAAARLRVAQPALSRQVQDLEDEIGVDLLKPEFLIPAGVVRIFGVDQAAKLIRPPRAMTGRRQRGPHHFRHGQAVTARSSAGRDAAHFSASDRRMTVFLPSFFALMRPRFTSS